MDGIRAHEEDGEWEVELVSAIVEALAVQEDLEESEDACEIYVSCARSMILISGAERLSR